VVWDKILFEAKAVEKLTDSHIKHVLNYLAASKLRLDLLVDFGGDFLEWEKGHFMRHETRISRSPAHADPGPEPALTTSCEFAHFVSEGSQD
jgi:hypothetical protein